MESNKKAKLDTAVESIESNGPVLTLSDLADDMIRYIGIVLCPNKVYDVWNVLARLNTSFAKRMSDPPLTAFQTTKEYQESGGKTMKHYLCGRLHRDDDLPAVIHADGSEYWIQHGNLHRDNDKPAEIHSDGTKRWFQHGKLHRDNDLPAVIWANGAQNWYQRSTLHRDNDLPAEIWANGTQKWYQHGKLHRDSDLPAEILSDGSQHWYQHDESHRDNDLPSTIYANGTRVWCQRGKLHRDNNLPAVVHVSGMLRWYQHGSLTKIEWSERVGMKYSLLVNKKKSFAGTILFRYKNNCVSALFSSCVKKMFYGRKLMSSMTSRSSATRPLTSGAASTRAKTQEEIESDQFYSRFMFSYIITGVFSRASSSMSENESPLSGREVYRSIAAVFGWPVLAACGLRSLCKQETRKGGS